MKIKTILISFIFLLLVGCGKSNSVEVTTKTNPNSIVLSGITYVLEEDDSELNMNYKVASNFTKLNFGNAIIYYSEKVNDSYNMAIKLFEYQDKDLDYAINDICSNCEGRKDVKIHDVDYTYLTEGTGENQIHLFFHKHNNNYYVITFAAKEVDKVEELYNLFLKNITYKD